ncbi:La-related protein 1C [Sesamum alatum]|uniref:La-related protein 1C n=1 Tax=Sesamum alatum TaxID=300844 RepID=A0AAE1YG63_9LAMI|nr:La-related protein 1C [Sesamum alatum]
MGLRDMGFEFCVTTEPRSPAGAASNGGVNSPRSRRRSLPSQWASVVRGDSDQISFPGAAASPVSSLSPPPEQAFAPDDCGFENSAPEAQPESCDANGDSNAGGARRPAWNRPLNDAVEAGSVMGGAISWPPLSESTRPVPRSSSDSFRPISDGSISSSQAPIISQPPQRQANTSSHAHSTANNSTRARSRNRGGGGSGGGSSGSGTSHNAFNRPSQPTPPQFPVLEVPYAMVPPMLDTPVTGTRPVRGVGGSQSHTGNEHSSQRNAPRRGNYGPRPRGDGPYHNNHGGRRDQDRRDVHLPPHYMPPPIGYMPPPLPPGAAPFMAPAPVRVFPGQMGFDMTSPFIYVPTIPPESFRAMPIVPPPPAPPVFFPPHENSLTNMIVKQIDYYFSDENLVKDSFLRKNMDNHGWVPITLIASFRRVHQLTNDIPLILESLKYSTIVEVQGDKLRRRNEWNKWLPSSSWSNTDFVPQMPGANLLATSLQQQVSLNDSMNNTNVHMEGYTEMATARPLSEELTGHSRENTAGVSGSIRA